MDAARAHSRCMTNRYPLFYLKAQMPNHISAHYEMMKIATCQVQAQRAMTERSGFAVTDTFLSFTQAHSSADLLLRLTPFWKLNFIHLRNFELQALMPAPDTLKQDFSNHNKQTQLSHRATGPALFTPARSDVLTSAPSSSIVSMVRKKNSF